jgi:protein-disulfide isomerase
MEPTKSSDKYLLPGSVLIGLILIAGVVYWNGQHPGTAGTQQAAGTAQTPPVNIKNVKTDGEPFMGQANAPITIAEWSDYQCPFCKQFELDTLPQIVQNYVDEGKVKIVFKDFAFLGPDSMVDAEYARAIWALYPTQFFAWRTAIYTQEPQENSLSAADNLTFLAKVINSVSGLNLSDIKAAVAANQATYDAAINADKTEAGNFGVNATPSFIVGTQLIAGAYPYSTFQSALDALAK